MASTYSTNLRLELIGTGEQQGSWGTTTNSNLGTLLEQAIGGYESITVSDVGDTTLTTANGSADQARNMTLNLVGTIGAARNVICPAAEKIYIVKNATTGGFAVTFKVTGQAGVSIPNGSTAVFYVDGTDARLVSQNPVPVTLGGTGATTSTGSGSVVLATSPALVTPNLGTPSAATLTNATGLPIVAGTTGTLSVARGGTGVTTSTGTGDVVLSTSATLTTPNLGTPSAATLTNATGLPIVAGTTGTLSVDRGGTGVTTSTGTGNVVLSASPTFTGVPLSTTAAADTNTTQLATTAYVIGQGYLKSSTASSTYLTSATAASTYAPLASPALSGVPTAPTAGGGTNNTQIATTAFVTAAVAASGSTSNQTYNSGSGNYIIPSGAVFVLARLWGGGGSGQNNVGAINTKGGGGGGYIEKLYLASDLGGAGAAVPYAVGAGGAAVGANVTAEGNPGGNSTFSSVGNLITAYGGGGSATLSGGGQTGVGTYGAGVTSGQDATLPWGGGAATSATTAQAGNSTYGGGGGAGGAATSGIGTGGASTIGGGGGNSGNNSGTAAQAGSAPAGGGGGTRSTTTPSGAGGAGRVQIIAW